MTDQTPCEGFPEEWQQIILSQLTYEIEHPSGNWSDFNRLVTEWEQYYTLWNILCEDEFPPYPDYRDYPNI